MLASSILGYARGLVIGMASNLILRRCKRHYTWMGLWVARWGWDFEKKNGWMGVMGDKGWEKVIVREGEWMKEKGTRWGKEFYKRECGIFGKENRWSKGFMGEVIAGERRRGSSKENGWMRCVPLFREAVSAKEVIGEAIEARRNHRKKDSIRSPSVPGRLSLHFSKFQESIFLFQDLTLAMFWRKQPKNDDNNSAEKDAKVRELRTAIEPQSGRSLKYCSEACLRRYLEARNWNVDKAQKMLESSLKWRATYKPEEIRWHEVAHEGETGKVSRANFHDRLGRTVLIMRPGMQNTASPEGNVRHLVYLIENAILNLPEGQEQMSWLIDFNGWSLNTNIPISTARDIIYVLQNHYPERLAVIILYSPPRIFEAFWKVVRYFVDPKTFQKIHFVYPNNKSSMELMKTFFDTENLPSEFGGKATLKYDHEEFSRLMVQEDVKTAEYWGFDITQSNETNGQSEAVVAPEPVSLASAAS
ncbi:hypothetical protein ACH5RR_013764 [Cinchona calisaya]|uniref:CRAL-TRIO domain-containing protein n=1 Tax=Cinchona calisaya TaxID=153742 RepID=A0ABD3A4M7_9GENT